MKSTVSGPLGALKANYSAAVILLTVTLGGCHSAFVQATVVNHSGGKIHVFEVDYPNASFGGSELAPGAQFHSRFKIQGNGPARVTWTDSAEREHTISGPDLHEGQEGTLTVAIEPTNAIWAAQLQGIP